MATKPKRSTRRNKNGILDFLGAEALRPSSALLIPSSSQILAGAKEAGRRAGILALRNGIRISAKGAREAANTWVENHYSVPPRGLSKRQISSAFQARYLLTNERHVREGNPEWEFPEPEVKTLTTLKGYKVKESRIRDLRTARRYFAGLPKQIAERIFIGQASGSKTYNLIFYPGRESNPIDWAETLAIGAGTAAGSLIGETIAGPLIERGKRFLGIGTEDREREGIDREDNPRIQTSFGTFGNIEDALIRASDIAESTDSKKYVWKKGRKFVVTMSPPEDFGVEVTVVFPDGHMNIRKPWKENNSSKIKLPLGVKGNIISNPSNTAIDEEAIRLTESFHGRTIRDVYDYDESDSYDQDLAELGELRELELSCNNGKAVCPLQFEKGKLAPRLASSPDGKQLYFIGGDQDLDDILGDLRKQKVDELSVHTSEKTIGGKRMIPIATVHTIAYFADKHHLTGPKQQKNGMEYEHEFGEKSGVKPVLFYDGMNKRMAIVGGDYFVTERGIEN